jgi:superfamily II DNA/RNA helicase
MDGSVIEHFIATNDPAAAVATLAHSRKILIAANTVQELDEIRKVLTMRVLWLLGSQSESDRMRSLQAFEESAEAALLFSLDVAKGWLTQTCSTLVALGYHADMPETAVSLVQLIAARPATTIYINCHPPKREEGGPTVIHGLLKECAECEKLKALQADTVTQAD